MIDILHIQKGDMVVYIPGASVGSPPIKSQGIYQDFTFSFSQCEPSVELCLNLIGQEERNKNLMIQIKARQVIQVSRP